jgi:excisionase family DNA binding protein
MSRGIPGTEAFLTTEEVLEYLQVNLRTVYRLIDAGQLPAVRVGRQWRFRRSDIDAWLDAQRAPRPAPAGAAPTPEPTAAAGRVLVLEPDGPHRDAAAVALRSAGHAVDTAPDGPLAADRLKQGSYDLLVTELRVPGADVFALIRAARRASPALRVLVVTGHSTETGAIEALNLGVSGYLRKPCRAAEIVATAARVMGLSER